MQYLGSSFWAFHLHAECLRALGGSCARYSACRTSSSLSASFLLICALLSDAAALSRTFAFTCSSMHSMNCRDDGCQSTVKMYVHSHLQLLCMKGPCPLRGARLQELARIAVVALKSFDGSLFQASSLLFQSPLSPVTHCRCNGMGS